MDNDGSYLSVWGDGTYIYAACYGDGIRAYTFDGSAFTLLDTQHDGGNYYGVWGDDTYIYAACLDDGIRAYSGFETGEEPWSNTCPVSSSESPTNRSTNVVIIPHGGV